MTIPPSTRSHILVVDDQPEDLAMLTSLLMQQGYAVRTAGDGESALAALRERAPELILLAARLPDADGYQLGRQLKADADLALAEVPLLFISPSDEPLDIGRTFAAGGADYLCRPLARDAVLARVRSQLQLRELSSQLAAATARLHQEIGRRSQAEHSLQEHLRRRAALISNLPGMAYRCCNDADWTMLYVSEGCLQLTGYQPAELLHNQVVGFNALIHPDDRARVWQVVQTAVGHDQPFQVTYRLRTRDGIEKWIWGQGIPVADPDGAQPLLEGFLIDISERIQAEAALLESEEKLRLLFEMTSDLVTLVDAEANTLWANPAWKNRFGGNLAERRNPFALIHPEDLASVSQAWTALVSQQNAIENLVYRFKGDDGVYTIFESSAFPVTLGDETMYYVVARDITARVRTERALVESEERFKRALENIPDMVVMHDAELRLQYANQTALNYVNRPLNELIGRREEDLWPPEVYSHYLPTLQRAAATREICSVFAEIPLPEQSPRYVHMTCVPIGDDAGRLRELLTIAQDLTEREQAQRTLRESKERFEKVIAQSPVPMVITRPNGDIDYYNDMFIKLFGYTLDDVSTAEAWWRHAYPDETYRQLVQRAWEVAIADAAREGRPIATQEWDITCKDGTVRRAEFDMMPLGDIAVIAMNDITERRRVEKELQQSREWLAVVFNHTTDLQLLAAVEADELFRVVAVNQRYIETARRSGATLSEDQIVGGSLSDILARAGQDAAALQQTLARYRQAAATGRPVTYREVLTVEKETVYLTSALIPVSDPSGKIQYVLYNSHDVSELKQTADALKRLNTELDERVRERTADLNKTVQLMAGREVRMAELKNVIRILRRQLQQAGLDPLADDPLHAV